MYIKKVEIKNVRSISNYTMEFAEGKEPGWHVLIGDNGSGKSTVIRAIALGLIGPDVSNGLYGYQDWNTWIPWNSDNGTKVNLTLLRDATLDKPSNNNPLEFTSSVEIKKNNISGEAIPTGKGVSQNAALYGKNAGSGWFCGSYGPFRRLSGGNEEFNFIVAKRTRLAAHLSAFREDFALSHVVRTLKDYELDSRSNKKAFELLQNLIEFINSSGLLHHGAKVEKIDSKGLNIQDGNGASITLDEMSDGYRSILSLTLDILLRLSEAFSPQLVFKKGSDTINIPGVILIDEIDAHLHPTWQIQIGQWFTRYFPKLQFIVTTHSPLICRGCVNNSGELNGSIWRLRAPGSSDFGGLLNEDDRDRLIYGNILDAYGTDVFGHDIEQSDEGVAEMKKYSELAKKEAFGANMTLKEKQKLEHLKKIFQTHAPIAF